MARFNRLDGFVSERRVGELKIVVFDDRRSLGKAAAAYVAAVMAKKQAAAAAQVRVVFAAAPSQNEFLAELCRRPGVDWTRVLALHMDEYLGIDSKHPASFRRFLKKHLFKPVGLTRDRVRLIRGEQVDRPLKTCLDYEEILKANPPDLVCAGIGENGHLAFNDPPVADFLDPVLVKVVRLDSACRFQQLNDGCFPRLKDVPTHAYTLTIPALMSASVISVVVPGRQKAKAVQAALNGPIDESCPASILRRHPRARLFLDKDAAHLVR